MAFKDWPKTSTSSDWSNVGGIQWPENQAPNTVNDSARAMGRDVAKWRDDINSTITSTGSSNAYVVTSNGSYDALGNGFQLSFKANFSNTGAATLNVDTLGAKAIRKFTASGEAALAANDIVSGGYYWVQYNTAANGAAGGWILLNASSIDGANLTALSVPTAAIAADAVTYAKIQNVSATSRWLGRFNSGAGDVEEGTFGAGLSLSGSGVLTGKIAQVVKTQTGAVTTGSTTIPRDDTIPQNTEGDQYMTLSITPTSATSTLIIQAAVVGSNSTTGDIVVALFQDSTANALAVASQYASTPGGVMTVNLTHTMTAGTTSATTFKIRVAALGGTFTFNGAGGGRYYGGTAASSITITEVLP